MIAWLASIGLAVSTLGCFSKPEFQPLVDAGPDPLAKQKIAAGDSHVCAIDGATKLWCWGDNRFVQVGPGAEVAYGVPQEVDTGSTGWTAVAAGARHACGVRDAEVYCWGRNDEHQVTSEIGAGVLRGVTRVEVGQAKEVFAGGNTSCALLVDDTVRCWGQLDLPGGAATGPEVLGSSAMTWQSVAITHDHGCAVDTSRRLFCWGDNSDAQLGVDPVSTPSAAFSALVERPNAAFANISVTPRRSCGVTDAGELVCFGNGGSGHLGPGIGDAANLGVDVGAPIGSTWEAAAAGLYHVCALAQSGDVHCYGDDFEGAVGRNAFQGDQTLGASVLSGVQSIVAGHHFSCASLVGGNVSCWGMNAHGELGDGEVAQTDRPARVEIDGQSILGLSVGDAHSCAIVQDGSAKNVWCWGRNDKQQVLGTSSSLAEPLPRLVGFVPGTPSPSFVQVAAGGRHSCARHEDQSVWCWGDNTRSQLGGAGIAPIRTAPAWKWIAAGSTTTCAIPTTETSFSCWGDVPGDVQRTSPTAFPVSGGMGTLSMISVGSGFAAMIESGTDDFQAFANSNCQTGVDPPTTNVTPHEPTIWSGVQATAIAAAGGQPSMMGDGHLCYNADTEITCMGDNRRNQAGPSSPVSCSPTNTVTKPGVGWATGPGTLTASGAHTCALSASNNVYCWGANDDHVLGALPSGGTPLLVHADATFSEIATGLTHTCGVTTSKTEVYCWGTGREGQLGDGSSYAATPRPTKFMP